MCFECLPFMSDIKMDRHQCETEDSSLSIIIAKGLRATDKDLSMPSKFNLIFAAPDVLICVNHGNPSLFTFMFVLQQFSRSDTCLSGCTFKQCAAK